MRRSILWPYVSYSFLAVSIVGSGLLPSWGIGGEIGSPQSLVVTRTFDGGSFAYEWQKIADRPDYSVYAVRFPSPVETALTSNNVVPGELFLPLGASASKPVPAVICLHILSGDRDLMELTCAALASRGVAAFMFRLPYYGERGGSEGPRIVLHNPSLFVDAIRQAWADIRRAVDLLSARPEILGDRVSVFGISFGGIVALGAAAEEPRLWRTLAVLAGGNLSRIMAHAKETEALRQALAQMNPGQRELFLQAIRSVDPLTYAPKLREKAAAGRVLLINAANDEVIPRTCTEELAAALGLEEKVVWLEGVGHYSSLSKLPQVLELTVGFFAQDVGGRRTVADTAAGEDRTATRLLSGILQQLVSILIGQTESDRGYRVEVSGWVRRGQAGKKTDFSVAFARGSAGRFRLSGQLPEVGAVAIGQERFPWIQAANGRLFIGSKPDQNGDQRPPVDEGAAAAPAHDETAGWADPLRFAEAEYVERVRMAAGIVAAVAVAPELLLKRGLRVEAAPEGTGFAIRISGVVPPSVDMTIRLAGEDRKPKSVTWTVDEWTGQVDIRAWDVDKPLPEEMFSPPSGQEVQEVPRDEVHRMFGAAFNFLVSRLVGK